MKTDQSGGHFSIIDLATSVQSDTPAASHCNRLGEVSERLNTEHKFSVGQFVRWKPGLKNRTFPDYGEPAIVRSILPSPIFDSSETSACSPYFQEPLSIIIGVIHDGEFLEFRMDGRRFEPFEY